MPLSPYSPRLQMQQRTIPWNIDMIFMDVTCVGVGVGVVRADQVGFRA